MKTRHGGNCGTTPFYLFPFQGEPEYDQGHWVVVWYDDLYDLSQRAVSPVPWAGSGSGVEEEDLTRGQTTGNPQSSRTASKDRG